MNISLSIHHHSCIRIPECWDYHTEWCSGPFQPIIKTILWRDFSSKASLARVRNSPTVMMTTRAQRTASGSCGDAVPPAEGERPRRRRHKCQRRSQLRRLVCPKRLFDMTSIFHRSKAAISSIFLHMMDQLNDKFDGLIYWGARRSTCAGCYIVYGDLAFGLREFVLSGYRNQRGAGCTRCARSARSTMRRAPSGSLSSGHLGI
jgi:hypothetical protein